MALDPELLEILACPKCKGELDYQEEAARLLCHNCRLSYRIE
ncbi:MAG: Trm112 family protein, partial [Dehalococcoidia bacterium]